MAKTALCSMLALVMVGATVMACGGGDSSGGDGTFGPGVAPTQGNNNNSNDTSGDPGNAGGSLGGSGGSSGGSNNTSSAPVDPSSACATSTLGATAVPLHMVIVFDRSGSMCEYQGDGGPRDCTNTSSKWVQATGAVKNFVSSADSHGIKASLIMFPFNDSGNAACSSSKYTTPLASEVALPDSTVLGPTLDQHVSSSGNTPTKDALTGAVSYANTLAAANPKDKVAIVLATDGEPSGCSDDTDNSVVKSAAVAAGVASTIPTYVVGVGQALTALDQIASSGGTTKAFTASTSTPAQTGTQLATALAAIRGATMSCTFNIPAAPTGQTLDYTKVNVSVTTKGTPSTIGYSPDCSDLNGWKYDNATAPTQVELCGTECTAVKADSASSVNLILGCTTQTAATK
jgi:hypothetical protein